MSDQTQKIQELMDRIAQARALLPEDVPLVTPDPTNPSRLPTGDEPNDLLRREILLAFEAEFDTFVHPFTSWGGNGSNRSFFIHEGAMFYYKPQLEKNIAERASEKAVDEQDPIYQDWLQLIDQIIPGFNPRDFSIYSLSDVRSVITAQPNGMPQFIGETPHFYQFVGVTPGARGLIIDDLTRKILDQIKIDFRNSIKPHPFKPYDDHLYFNEGKFLWTDLETWTTHRLANDLFLGISFQPKEATIQYPSAVNNTYFFAFDNPATWTEEQKQLVELMSVAMTDNGKRKFQIIYLT